MKEQKKQPELRFKGFTDDWEQVKLETLANISSGGTPSREKKEYWNGNIYWVTTADVNYKVIKNTDEKITQAGIDNSSAKLMPSGTILMAMYGQGKTRGQVGILGVSAATNQANANILVNIDVDTLFIYQQLVRDYKRIRALANEGGQANLSLGIVGSLLIQNTLKIKEQEKIGEFFQKLDHTITLQQRKLELLKKLKQGYLQKLLSINKQKVPELRFIISNKVWELRKIKEIFKITRGQVLAVKEVNDTVSSTAIYPVYSSQTKNNGLLGYYKDYLFDTAITWTTDGANAGTVKFRNGKFYSTNVNGVLLSNEGYANYAVAEIINLVAWKWVSHVGNPKLMNNVMGDIGVYIPTTIEEQNQISNFLEELNKKIAYQELKRELSIRLKQAYLQKLFP